MVTSELVARALKNVHLILADAQEMAGGCSFCWLAAAGCCGWCARSGGHCHTTQPSVGLRQKLSALRRRSIVSILWGVWCCLQFFGSLGYSLVTQHGNGNPPVCRGVFLVHRRRLFIVMSTRGSWYVMMSMAKACTEARVLAFLVAHGAQGVSQNWCPTHAQTL